MFTALGPETCGFLAVPENIWERSRPRRRPQKPEVRPNDLLDPPIVFKNEQVSNRLTSHDVSAFPAVEARRLFNLAHRLG